MNRRSFLKRFIASGIAFLGLSSGGYYYAREIEPNSLKITREIIASSRIPKPFNQIKIIQFSDTHVGFHYTIHQLEKLVSTINNLEPDIIVFTGDLLDEPQTYHTIQPLIDTLRKFQAEHGKYWVYGNHDHGGYGTDIVKQIMDESDFKLLQNSHTNITLNNSEIVLAGIDDTILGSPNIERALEGAKTNLFTILLSHEPDFADITKNHPVDVQLSGHSHGGQIRLPFLGHIYTPIEAEKYIQGKYSFDNDKLTLYVNQGIGTTRLPFRLFCKPEIHLYTLEHR